MIFMKMFIMQNWLQGLFAVEAREFCSNINNRKG